ncbi:MAG: hypothetical protein IIB65_12740, partial [Proteobacteria bacterium]|nr:hypothetical protein [Pseudomonadota bacterium]
MVSKPARKSPAGKSKGKKAGKSARRRRRLFSFGWFIKWSLVAFIWSSVFAGAVLAWYAYDLPEVESVSALTRRPAVTLLASDGKPFARFGEVHGRTVMIADLPRHVPRAV